MAKANGIDATAEIQEKQEEEKDVKEEEVEVKSEIKKEVEAEVEAEVKTEVKAEVVKKEESDGTEASENEPPTALEKQIIRQVEYYFGDINLPRDKFLKDQMKLDDGWIPLDVMLKFKRLSNLTADVYVVISALQKSQEKLMEVDVVKKKIRRSPDRPLPELNEERRKELVSRTVYVKGFPATGPTLDILLDFFNAFGPVENVSMRSYRDRAKDTYVFKGSVFVIFSTREIAEQFLNRQCVSYEGTELIRKWQSVYLEEKRKEREENKQTKRLAAAQKRGELEEEELPKGSVLHITGISGDATREEIRSQLTELGAEVAFITFAKGDAESWVRLQQENAAQQLLDKVKEKKLTVCGVEVDVRALEGEEEVKFLEKAKEDMLKRRQLNTRNRRGGRRGGGGGGGRGGSFQGNRKRKGDETGDGPPPKQTTAS